MAAYKITLRGTAVYVSYYHKGRAMLPVGVTVPAKYFNVGAKEGKWVKPDCPGAHDLNTTIQERLNELRTHCNRFFQNHHHYPAPKTLKGFFKRGKAPAGFFDMFKQFIQHQTHKGAGSVGLRTMAAYNTTLSYLQQYNPALQMLDITPTFYDRFCHWLTNSKGLTRPGSVGMHIKVLKAFLNWLQVHHDVPVKKSTLQYFKAAKTKPEVHYHTGEELQKIIDANLSLLPHLEPVRDLYLILCFTGLRIGDFKTARWEIYTDYIRRPAQKTSQAIVIPIRPETRAILDKYLKHGHPIPKISEKTLNNHLKALGRLAGITQPVVVVNGKRKWQPGAVVTKNLLMSTHMGRSTFICNQIESDIHFQKIMAQTGIKSYETLKHYAGVVDVELTKAMERVVEKQQLRITHLNAKTA